MTDQSSSHILNPDTQAVLLLCGRFGGVGGDVKPLTQSEYDTLAEWLLAHEMRPAALLAVEGVRALEEPGRALPVTFERLRGLLERGGAMALAMEGWTNRGLWVISRSDASYPRRFRTGRLGPPVLYGAGNAELLSRGGLAIVGSREVDAEGISFTRRVARTCAAQGVQVVSGGARGVDSEAMLAALDAGGTAVGVLSDSLARTSVAKGYRDAIMRGDLALVSPYDPNAGFDVGGAMGRNKHIYGLADWALVVSAAAKKGGTWAGAIEALKGGKKPIFVRTAGRAPEGNLRLIEKGAHPFPPEPWADLAAMLSAQPGEDGGPPNRSGGQMRFE